MQDAFLYPGIKMRLTRADLIGLDLIGYDVPATLTVSQARLLNQPSDPNYFFVAPEPDAIGLLAAGIGGLALLRRHRHREWRDRRPAHHLNRQSYLSCPRFFWTPICPTGGRYGEVQHERDHAK